GKKRIMNGKQPQHVLWPWFVRLENGNSGCGGSLVSDRHVLTAAHCFDDTGSNEDYWQAYVGVVNLNETLKAMRIIEIILHKDYDKDSTVFRNDIALLTLFQPVQFSDKIKAVCLPPPDHVFLPGTKCWTAGFGETSKSRCVCCRNAFYVFNPYHARRSSDLKEVSVDIIGQADCNSQKVHNGMILQSMLCAGHLKGGGDACSGDSGGPLVCGDQDDLWYLTGIVSWGVDCGRPNKPGVYTNVSHFINWIQEKRRISSCSCHLLKNWSSSCHKSATARDTDFSARSCPAVPCGGK
ncbi:hypothetical protein NFI96_018531, partial [Prochilodus magdalenae]